MVDKEKSKTIVDRIRKLLLNYDLSIAYGNSEIQRLSAVMELYKGKRGKAYKSFIQAKVDKQRYELYVEEIGKAKNELVEKFEIITEKYIDKYKKVFVSFFIEGKSYEEIATLTNYSIDAINHIIRKLKTDLIDLFDC